jgi:nitrate/nitrite transporter NarK
MGGYGLGGWGRAGSEVAVLPLPLLSWAAAPTVATAAAAAVTAVILAVEAVVGAVAADTDAAAAGDDVDSASDTVNRTVVPGRCCAVM